MQFIVLLAVCALVAAVEEKKEEDTKVLLPLGYPFGLGYPYGYPYALGYPYGFGNSIDSILFLSASSYIGLLQLLLSQNEEHITNQTA